MYLTTPYINIVSIFNLLHIDKFHILHLFEYSV